MDQQDRVEKPAGRTDRERRSALDADAAEWLVRLHGAPDGATRRAFAAWLAADPAHGRHFQDAQASWALLGRVKTPAPRRLGRLRSGRRVLLAGGAAALAGAGLWLRAGPRGAAGMEEQRSGQVATRTVTLTDGSRVTLAPGSAIRPAFDARVRRVALLNGEALFAPAPVGNGEARPFEVQAAGGCARALGTRFVVNLLAREAELTVLEHRVELILRPDGAAEPGPGPRIGAGQQVRYGAEAAGPVRQVDPAAATAWLEGRLAFDRTSLPDAATMLERYRGGHIVIGSKALEARLVSGVFRADAAHAALRMIARELGARLIEAPLGLAVLI